MSSQKNKLNNLHLLGFFLCFITLNILVFYQLFVDEKYYRIPPKVFLNPKTLKTAIKSLSAQKIPPDISRVFFLENGGFYKNPLHPEPIINIKHDIYDNQVFTSPQNDKLAFLTKNNSLIIIKDDKPQIIKEFPENQTVQIINWGQNNNDLWLAIKQENWSIVKLTGEKIEVIKKNIVFPNTPLTKNISYIKEKIVYPDCRQTCQFMIFDINTNATQEIPALVDNNPDTRIKDLLFAFYDEKSKLIAYQRVPGDEPFKFYVVGFDKTLLQTINLDLPEKQIEFVGYYPESQEMLFVSKNSQDKNQELFAYKANKPSLKILGKIGNNQTVEAISSGGFYEVDNTLKNIFDKDFGFDLGDKKIISVL